MSKAIVSITDPEGIEIFYPIGGDILFGHNAVLGVQWVKVRTTEAIPPASSAQPLERTLVDGLVKLTEKTPLELPGCIIGPKIARPDSFLAVKLDTVTAELQAARAETKLAIEQRDQALAQAVENNKRATQERDEKFYLIDRINLAWNALPKNWQKHDGEGMQAYKLDDLKAAIDDVFKPQQLVPMQPDPAVTHIINLHKDQALHIRDLNLMLDNKDKEIKDLKAKVDASVRDRSEVNRQLGELRDIEHRFNTARQENSRLAALVKDSVARMKELDGKGARARNKLLRRELTLARQALQKARNDARVSAYEELVTKFNNRIDEIEKLKLMVKARDATIAEQKDKVAHNLSTLFFPDQSKEAQDTLVRERDQARAESERLQLVATDLDTRCRELKDAVEAGRQTIVRLENDIAKLRWPVVTNQSGVIIGFNPNRLGAMSIWPRDPLDPSSGSGRHADSPRNQLLKDGNVLRRGSAEAETVAVSMEARPVEGGATISIDYANPGSDISVVQVRDAFTTINQIVPRTMEDVAKEIAELKLEVRGQTRLGDYDVHVEDLNVRLQTLEGLNIKDRLKTLASGIEFGEGEARRLSGRIDTLRDTRIKGIEDRIDLRDERQHNQEALISRAINAVSDLTLRLDAHADVHTKEHADGARAIDAIIDALLQLDKGVHDSGSLGDAITELMEIRRLYGSGR